MGEIKVVEFCIDFSDSWETVLTSKLTFSIIVEQLFCAWDVHWHFLSSAGDSCSTPQHPRSKEHGDPCGHDGNPPEKEEQGTEPWKGFPVDTASAGPC